MNKLTIVSLSAILLVGCGESQKELRLKSLFAESQKQQQTLREQVTTSRGEIEHLTAELKEASDSDTRARGIIATLQKELLVAQTESTKLPPQARSFDVPAPALKKDGVKDVFVFPVVLGPDKHVLLRDAELRAITGLSLHL